MSQKTKIREGLLLSSFILLTAVLVFPCAVYALGTPTGTAITNQASVNYQDSFSNNYSANSNTVTTTVSSVYSVSVNSPADKYGNSNTTVDYTYTVTNTGNANNTFSLSAASGAGWTVTLYADDGAGSGTANDGIRQGGETNVTNSSGSLIANATYKFFVSVTIPANTADGTTDGTTTLTVTGSGDAGAGDDTSDNVLTTVQAPLLSITKNVRNVTAAGSFNTTATADPGNTLEYRIQVTNSGTVIATSVTLTDSDNAYTTYTGGSIWIGPDGATYNGAGNSVKTDSSSGDAVCASDACGAANESSGNITAYLGNGATESAGGSLGIGSTAYIYFRVTVD